MYVIIGLMTDELMTKYLQSIICRRVHLSLYARVAVCTCHYVQLSGHHLIFTIVRFEKIIA